MLQIGKLCYDAYCKASGGKSLVSGQPLPDWEALSEPIKSAWEAAEEAARHQFEQQEWIDSLRLRLAGAENFLRGMQLDPNIPAYTKSAIAAKLEDLIDRD